MGMRSVLGLKCLTLSDAKVGMGNSHVDEALS